MVDTRRTWSALQTLLADNTAGAIGPQDLRDAVYSVVPPFGGVYHNGTPTTTAVASANTDYVTDWNSGGAQTNVRDFTASTAGRLTYDGTVDIHAHIVASISFSVSVAADKHIQFKLYKNATTLIAGSELEEDTDGNTTIHSLALHADATLSTNDYIEIWVSNETDTTDVQVEKAYFFAQAMIVTS